MNVNTKDFFPNYVQDFGIGTRIYTVQIAVHALYGRKKFITIPILGIKQSFICTSHNIASGFRHLDPF